jgi:hypothetical protein
MMQHRYTKSNAKKEETLKIYIMRIMSSGTQRNWYKLWLAEYKTFFILIPTGIFINEAFDTES